MSTSSNTGVVSERFAPFGTTIFAEMTQLANEHRAVNLSQGFPDFEGPTFIKEAAMDAIRDHHNQYARPAGEMPLVEALAESWSAATGLDVDPMSEITVTCGCTEALAASIMGLVNPGEEVILFEPFYDSYRACLAMAGAESRFVTLERNGSGFGFDIASLERAFGDRTKAILINTPHNPTGKVFSREELEVIASLCQRHDVIAITDEVYEHLVYEPATHVRLATLPGMQDRTLTLSSLGKTFSLTGWKIGWAIGPAHLTKGIRAAHQFMTFTVPTPLQHGAAAAIRDGHDEIAALVDQYRSGRDFLASALREIGFDVVNPDGTYFIMADHSAFGFADDVSFCRHLTTDVGVAAIPPSAFYEHPEHGKRFVRFAFCKTQPTLDQAVERLRRLQTA